MKFEAAINDNTREFFNVVQTFPLFAFFAASRETEHLIVVPSCKTKPPSALISGLLMEPGWAPAFVGALVPKRSGPSRESGSVRNKSATILRGWIVENRVPNTTNRPKTGQAEQAVT